MGSTTVPNPLLTQPCGATVPDCNTNELTRFNRWSQHRLVQDAVDATEPTLVFHGHWHQENRCHLHHGTEIVGLAADGNPPSAAVLSVQDLQAAYVDPLQRSHHR